MIRLLSWLVSAVLTLSMFTTFAACGDKEKKPLIVTVEVAATATTPCGTCLLYTSDAADEL